MSQTQTKRNYRASFILDTRGLEESVDDLVNKLKSTLESLDCEIKKTENLGQKDFTRPTDRSFPSGIYIQIDFAGPAEAPATFKDKLKLDRKVHRILIESQKES